MKKETLSQFNVFAKRAFCPIVSVNLHKLRDECNVDLFPWLQQFEPLISIHAAYTPRMVQVFYFNMVWDNLVDDEDNIIEERITTHLGSQQKITISAAFLNSVLNISDPPPVPKIDYTNREIWQILRPNEPIPDVLDILTFKPIDMPPMHRVVWYIYTRNLMQKGGHFTTFAKKDYPLFASLMSKTPHNIGHWIFQEMARFRFNSRKNSDIPFPSLISIILFHEKIWHLGTAGSSVKPTIFGKNQLNFMKLNFQEGSGQSRAPSQQRSSRPRAQEAQSAPPDLDTRIQAIVDKAFSDMTETIELEVGKLIAEVKMGNSDSVDAQEEIKSKLIEQDAKMSTLMVSHMELSTKLDSILKVLHSGQNASAGPSSSTPGPSFDFSPAPSASTPSFTFTTPIISTPNTEVLPDSTPATEPVPPSHTSTVKLSSPTASPSHFGDDKGGEN